MRALTNLAGHPAALLIANCLVSGPAWAQAPLNDNPCGAMLLSLNGNLCTAPTVSTNTGATSTTVAGHTNPTPGCPGGGTQPHDVWYVFQTAATGLGSFGATVTVTGNPAGQLRLYATPSCTGPFTLLECSAAATPNTAAPRLVTGALQPSRYYYVAVNGATDADPTGAFTICVSEGPGVPTCGAPVFLGSGSVNATSAQIGFRDGASGGGPYQGVLMGGGTTRNVTATASPLLLTGLAPATTYQLTLTGLCTGGGPTPSAGLSFSTPTGYCTAGLGGNCSANAITAFALLNTTLNNTTQIPPCEDGRGSGGGILQAYTFFAPGRPSNTATLLAGTTYQASVVADGPSGISAWLDANRDGNFDASEWTELALATQNGQASIAALTVPATALPGPTGLRIRSRTAGSPNTAGAACTNFLSGEVEDYTVTIALPTAATSAVRAAERYPYPNPATDIISIPCENPNAVLLSGQLYIYNALGQEIYEKELTANTPLGLVLSVKAWPNGLYSYVLVQPNKVVHSIKFIVHH